MSAPFSEVTELTLREERFRSLITLFSDWVWETDTQDCFTYLSAGKADADKLAASLLGLPRRHFIADPQSDSFLAYQEKVQAREFFRDIRVKTNDNFPGGVRWLSLTGEPVYERGEFKGFRGISRDVTREVELSNKLARLAAENAAIVDNSLDLLIVVDAEGRFKQVNQASRAILGYAPEELVGRLYIEFVLPEDMDKTLTAAAYMAASGQGVSGFENRWVRKDGAPVHLEWSCRYSNDRKIMYATARDMTERHATRDQLQRTNETLNAILERLGQGFFTTDRDFKVLYANPLTADFAQRSVAELMGKALWESVPEVLGTPAMALFKTAMETGQPQFHQFFYAPNQVWLDVRVFPHEEGLSVFFTDITALREATQSAAQNQARVRSIIELTPAGYIQADANGVMVDANQALCQLTGYERHELLGQRLLFITEVCPLSAKRPGPGPATFDTLEISLKHKQGMPCHALLNVNAEHDDHGVVKNINIFLTDITQRKQAEAQMEKLATRDALTGLPNRTSLNRQLEMKLQQAGDAPVAVMFIDLDRFKEVNDTLGHEYGDLLLQQVAERLQHSLRAGDIVARLGGDEFIVAAPCDTGPEGAERVARKILTALTEPFNLNGHETYIGGSIGISMYPEDGVTTDQLFQHADTAMYAAKNGGRNDFRFYATEMGNEAKQRVFIEKSLRKALERNEFHLHFQPRLNLKTGAVAGIEALLRWDNPVLGRVSPAEFIPIAEERGYISAIGNWVLGEACKEGASLRRTYGRDVSVSVNLSAKQLRNTQIIGHVQDALAASGLPPHLLELELTETVLIEDIEGSVPRLNALKELGVSLSVDDFGTGYSSLSYLRKFPISTLKLDRSFILDVESDARAEQFIKAFVDMAHALNMSVVAEGVETIENVALLQGTACDEVQGFYFARPMPITDLKKFLEEAARPASVKGKSEANI